VQSALFTLEGMIGPTCTDEVKKHKQWETRRSKLVVEFNEWDWTTGPFVMTPFATLLQEINPEIASVKKKADKLREELKSDLKELLLEINLGLSDMGAFPSKYYEQFNDVGNYGGQLDVDNLHLLRQMQAKVEDASNRLGALRGDGKGFGPYEKLLGDIKKIRKRLKEDDVAEFQPGRSASLMTKSDKLKADLEKQGPTGDNTALAKLIQALDQESQEVKARARLFKSYRDKFMELEKRIRVEVPRKAKAIDNTAEISPDRIPLLTKLETSRALLTSATATEAAIKQALQSLTDSLALLLENDDAINDLISKDRVGKMEDKTKALIESENEATYLNLLQQANDAVKECKEKKANKKTLKVIKDLISDAKKTAKEKDFVAAGQQAAYALKMANELAADPLGSNMTGRGREQLKKLAERWRNALKQVDTHFKTLAGNVDAACKKDNRPQVLAAAQKFKDMFKKRFTDRFKEDAFDHALIMLQGEPPTDEGAKEKDRAMKKKFREEALKVVRDIRKQLTSDPFLDSLTGRTPFGSLHFVPLVRALDDIDLNVQRTDE
jgi:hypothetical protein